MQLVRSPSGNLESRLSCQRIKLFDVPNPDRTQWGDMTTQVVILLGDARGA
ncbi:hypothetical protein [Mycetohabitans endofungorum]|uniref:Uncharacterized protein n=2 Tax=Mycetohabitans TaxID=2571159 RepID=A0A2P5K7C0_9BURK|nr:hypothetical protein [Mycetohabitans endofungorum]PPB81964.1 hypothetical protein B0O95_11623 [Mycetohabitans endofungorum]